jgi:hypothetical protein
LRKDCPDVRAKFGLSGYANTETVAKEEALPPTDEAEEVSERSFPAYVTKSVKRKAPSACNTLSEEEVGVESCESFPYLGLGEKVEECLPNVAIDEEVSSPRGTTSSRA